MPPNRCITYNATGPPHDDRRIEAARGAHGDKRLPLEVDRAVREQFWASVDKGLDDLEVEIGQRGPRK